MNGITEHPSTQPLAHGETTRAFLQGRPSDSPQHPYLDSVPASMTFRVGPFNYRLHIVRQRPLHRGERCDGVIELDGERIEVYAGISGPHRLNTLLHQLGHAWNHHFDKPAGLDESANRFALAAQCAFQELLEQGGIEALNAMLVGDSRHAENSGEVDQEEAA